MNEIIKFVKSDKRIIITGVIILFLVVLGTFLAFTVGSVAFTLENDLEVMGKDFYENFYYDQLKSSDEERSEFLSKFQSQGIKINLSNLVRSNKEVNEEKAKEFVNPKTKEPCDMENTKVIIYPKSPYGKKDYTIEVDLVCGLEDDKK